MWLVQYAGGPVDNGDKVMGCLALKGVPCHAIGIRPFDTEIMGIDGLDLNEKVVCYGSVKLVRLALELGIRPGVFFDYSTFNAMAWKHFLPGDMVNHMSFHSIDTLCSEPLEVIGQKRALFIRPVMDLKLFSGSVKPEGQSLRDFFSEKLYDDHSVRYKNTLVGIAHPKSIEGEWRCFIVDRKLVTGSQYRLGGELRVEATLPDGLEDYVATICGKWLPHDHCVMDVALVDGEFKVMEFNCINASGLYAADVEKFVDAMNSLMV